MLALRKASLDCIEGIDHSLVSFLNWAGRSLREGSHGKDGNLEIELCCDFGLLGCNVLLPEQ